MSPAIDYSLAELRSVGDFLRWAASTFAARGLHFGHGTDNAWDEARWLVMRALELPFDAPEWVLGTRLTALEHARLAALLRRRIEERVPVALLLGEAWFAGLRFRVDASTLVPRSPIAELIDAGFEPWLAGLEPLRILDLCCGGGCIGIAAALRFPEARVDLADISAPALAIARLNVADHGLADRVVVIESDLFAALAGRRYDLVLCNPPYVDAEDMAALPPEFAHEPRSALASGDDGLDLVRRILDGIGTHLEPDGMLVLEVGNSAAALEDAFPRLPFFWPEFARGGHGVALLRAAEIAAAR